MSSCLIRKYHCRYKTILRTSYLHNGISYDGKIMMMIIKMMIVIKIIIMMIIIVAMIRIITTTTRITIMIIIMIMKMRGAACQPSAASGLDLKAVREVRYNLGLDHLGLCKSAVWSWNPHGGWHVASVEWSVLVWYSRIYAGWGPPVQHN